MDLLEELKSLGVDVDGGVKRLGGNENIYKKMLGSFLKMMKQYEVDPDFGCENYDEVIERAHAIKGGAGNLVVTPIYESYTEIVDLLRKGEPVQAKESLRKILPVQDKIVQAIERSVQ